MWTSRGGRSQGEGRQVSILSNPVSPFPKGSHVHSTSYTRASMQGYNRTTGLCSSRGSPGWQQRGAWWTSTHGPAVKQPCQLSFIALGLENARPSWQPINTSMSDALASTCTRCPQNDCQRWGSCYCCVLTAMLDSRGRMYVNVTTLAPKEIVHPQKKNQKDEKHDFLSSVEHKEDVYIWMSSCSFPYNESAILVCSPLINLVVKYY